MSKADRRFAITSSRSTSRTLILMLSIAKKVPRAGRTVVVVDVTAGELRQVTNQRRDDGVKVNAGQSRSVLSLPPKVLDPRDRGF